MWQESRSGTVRTDTPTLWNDWTTGSFRRATPSGVGLFCSLRNTDTDTVWYACNTYFVDPCGLDVTVDNCELKIEPGIVKMGAGEG